MVEPNRGQNQRTTNLDEALVEPARRGIRKVGTGLGAAASSLMIAGGTVSGLFGGLVMALTTGFFAGLGGFFLAAGITGVTIGSLTLFAVRRADSHGDIRQVERRLIKLVRAHGRMTDEAIAERVGVGVKTIRETANGLVKSGVLDVDIDPNTGADVYTIVPAAGQHALMPADEAAAFDDFDERVRSGHTAPHQAEVRHEQAAPEYEER